MTRHSTTSSLQHAKMCQLANQPVFDLLLLLPALSVTSNPRLRRTANKNKGLNHIIPTDDTPPIDDTILPIDDTILLIDNTIPPTVSTATKVKGVLYAENLDAGLRTIQRTKKTGKYDNISPILKATTTKLKTIITKEISL